MLSKSNFKTVVALGLSSLVISSCSTGYTYKKPESFEEKISRYEARSMNTNIVPEVQINEKFSYKTKRSRGPASVSDTSDRDDGLNQYNNKRLYFLTLYSQYKEIMPLASSDTVGLELNHCPSFHTSYLSHNESTPMRSTTKEYKLPFNDMKMMSNSNFMASYPEFYLPVAKSSTRPRVIDVALKDNLSAKETKELIEQSINVHLSKTYSELSELCDTGSSSNYYIYENLMTHIKSRNKISADKSGLQTLFKTTLFSNMALTNSIKKHQKTKSRGIASFAQKQSFDKEVIKRLEVPWVESYLQSK
ncbi:hypothetical protein [Halobacteriovorax sp.]|uniref:hypothetical protein n=1 Tax=Halobacteriovorax sp. TaxID=2020862 RepID=UPI00356394E7